MKLIIVLFFMPFLTFSQHTIAISVNDSLELNLLTSKYNFIIRDKISTIKLDEETISHYRFKNIGVYKIYTQSTDDHSGEHRCTHIILPDSFFVYVDSIKMKFDAKSISTSKPIVKNQSTEGIDLFIDVEIENTQQSKIKMNLAEISSAGIGTNIKGKLDESFQYILPGKHKLKYKLSGLCTEASYLQFDFIHHNGKIEPISLSKPVIKY